jgi:hypothetical protein
MRSYNPKQQHKQKAKIEKKLDNSTKEDM